MHAILDYLLKDNLKFAEILCSCPLAGKQSSAVANLLLKVLILDEDLAESFICKLLKERLLLYKEKSKELFELTRDNRYENW